MLLLLAALGALMVGVLLLRLSQRRKRALRIPDGDVVYQDHESQRVSPLTLVSERLGLRGKPDHRGRGKVRMGQAQSSNRLHEERRGSDPGMECCRLFLGSNEHRGESHGRTAAGRLGSRHLRHAGHRNRNYTIFAQLVSHETGIPLHKVDVVLGDTALPSGPISGGSWTTASVTPVVLEASQKAAQMLLTIATKTPESPFQGKKPEDLEMVEGSIQQKGQAATKIGSGDVLKLAKVKAASGSGSSQGNMGDPKAQYSFHSFGAQFVEVTWQPEIARFRVSRVMTIIDAGRMLNPRAARNQIEGAVVMGVGMAMLKATEYDQRSGAPINSNLADYIVAVSADCPEIDVTFLDYPDYHLNALGARGVGEIGLAGLAPALLNAVYHATGIRMRSLPVRIEDLLAAPPACVTDSLAVLSLNRVVRNATTAGI